MYEIFLGAVVLLWVVFLVSAASKSGSARRQRAFAASLRPLKVLPERLLAPAALAVTVAEIAVVAGLSWVLLDLVVGVPGSRSIAAAALATAIVLVAVLTGGIVLALRRGTRASCACFGAAERPLSRRHLVRNGLLILIAAGGAVVVDHVPPDAAEPPAVLLAGSVGAVVALVLIRLDDLVELFAPVGTTGKNRARS
jgi:hypothetical protein